MTGAFGGAVGDLRASTWQNTEELLAANVEAVRDLTWLTQIINTDKNKPRPKQPARIARPWQKERQTRKRNATSEEIAAMFGGRVRYVPKSEE